VRQSSSGGSCRDYGEVRMQAIGQVGEDVLFVVYTDRNAGRQPQPGRELCARVISVQEPLVLLHQKFFRRGWYGPTCWVAGIDEPAKQIATLHQLTVHESAGSLKTASFTRSVIASRPPPAENPASTTPWAPSSRMRVSAYQVAGEGAALGLADRRSAGATARAQAGHQPIPGA
jgi:hypothetical protein